MSLTDKQTHERICALNDALRRSLAPKLGRIVLTACVDALPGDLKAMAVHRTANFDAFSRDTDPADEHECGSFDLEGRQFIFTIDYFDPRLEFGSDDPADPVKTTRVLTLMLAEEY